MSVYSVLSRCITMRDYRDLRTVLAPDCVMTSMWVLEDMHGAGNIYRHWSKKAAIQRKQGIYPLGKMGLVLYPDSIELCVGQFYPGKKSPEVIFLLESQKMQIHKIDICDPELFTYTFDEKEMAYYMDYYTRLKEESAPNSTCNAAEKSVEQNKNSGFFSEERIKRDRELREQGIHVLWSDRPDLMASMKETPKLSEGMKKYREKQKAEKQEAEQQSRGERRPDRRWDPAMSNPLKSMTMDPVIAEGLRRIHARKQIEKKEKLLTDEEKENLPYHIMQSPKPGHVKKRITSDQLAELIQREEERQSGEERPVQFCHKCGAKLLKDSAFCSYCGTKCVLSEEKSVPDRKMDPGRNPGEESEKFNAYLEELLREAQEREAQLKEEKALSDSSNPDNPGSKMEWTQIRQMELESGVTVVPDPRVMADIPPLTEDQKAESEQINAEFCAMLKQLGFIKEE